MRLRIATALGVLLAADSEDDELSTLVFRSAAIAAPNAGASLLCGLTPTWATRPQLPVNILLLSNRLLLSPYERRTVCGNVNNYIAAGDDDMGDFNCAVHLYWPRRASSAAFCIALTIR
jgi:hypothetical protein